MATKKIERVVDQDQLNGDPFHGRFMYFNRAIILVTLLTCWMNLSHASEIQFMTHNIQGKTYQDGNGELRGIKHSGRRAFNLELVREMMVLLNYPIKIIDIPFKRGLLYVQSKQDHALFNVTRKPSRENTVKWVGPLQSDKAYFYELKSAPTEIQTLEDAKKIKGICVLNGNIHDEFLQKSGFDNLMRNNSYAGCFKMLAHNRVSLTPSSALSLNERLKAAGISPQDIERTPVLLFNTDGYLAFSKNISDDVVNQWQNALDKLKRSGKYDQLVQEYLLPE